MSVSSSTGWVPNSLWWQWSHLAIVTPSEHSLLNLRRNCIINDSFQILLPLSFHLNDPYGNSYCNSHQDKLIPSENKFYAYFVKHHHLSLVDFIRKEQDSNLLLLYIWRRKLQEGNRRKTQRKVLMSTKMQASKNVKTAAILTAPAWYHFVTEFDHITPVIDAGSDYITTY